MNRLDYLYFAVQHKCYREKRWIISVFTQCIESEEQKQQLYIGKIIREPFGVFYLDEALQKQPLEVPELKPTDALFGKYDKVTLTKDKLPWLGVDQVESTVGRLLLNLIAVYEPFEGRMPYVNDAGIVPSDIEKRFITKLKDELPEGATKDLTHPFQESHGFLELDEFIHVEERGIFAQSVTREGALPAPGTTAFRKEVLKRYEGKLHDPNEMVRFQEELNQFDNKYLKENDPSYGRFMSKGKITKARSRGFLTQGGDSDGFSGSVEMVPITQPLTEGIDFTPEKFTSIANTIRYGSYAKGTETMNGGVVAKALMTALDTWSITDKDCSAKLGAVRKYDAANAKLLVNRYIIGPKGEAILIQNKDQAAEYIGKEVIIRSPQYCREEGTHTCKVCAGVDLARFGSGLVIPAMEVSSGIMSDSLKKMHDTTASSKPMDLQRVIS